SDIATLVSWLNGEGFTVDRVHANNVLIEFSGTAAQIERTFATQIHYFDVEGERHFMAVDAPTIPAAIAPVVAGVLSFDDFRPTPTHEAFAAPLLPRPDYTESNIASVVPADLATIYDFKTAFNAGLRGDGQTIALIEDTDIANLADVATFRSVFGLPATTVSTVHPGCTDPGVFAAHEIEATLDAEWAGAAAPNANLQIVSCGGASGIFGAMAGLLNTGPPPPSIWSVSYGACEALNAGSAAGVNQIFQQAAARGVSVYVAAGDSGGASCDASHLTAATQGLSANIIATPAYVVAVGGTDFGDVAEGTLPAYWNTTNDAVYGSARSYINEIPWNSSCAGQLLSDLYSSVTGAPTYGAASFCNSVSAFRNIAAGGGGASIYYAKPAWQTGFYGAVNDGARDVPDISLFAANGSFLHSYVLCDSSQGACTGAPSSWGHAGGTSFAAPIWAGIQALVNQRVGAVGNPNPTIYALAAAHYGSTGNPTCNSENGPNGTAACIFHDITRGDTDVPCTGNNNCYLPGGTYGVLSKTSVSFQPTFRAAIGWDFATGFGSVDVANLVNAWPAPPAKLVFTGSPSATYTAGSSIVVTVSVEGTTGVLSSNDTSAITLALTSPNGATLNGTTTVNAVAGVATFSVAVTKAGSYTLTATDGALTAATSTPFNIVAGAPTVSFTVQPAPGQNVTAGAAIPITARLADSFGNAITGHNITLAFATAAAGGVLVVPTNPVAPDANGNAVFTNVSIAHAGSGYSLQATASYPGSHRPAATGNTFNIVAAPASTLSFVQQPTTTALAATMTPPVIVRAQDSFGNPVMGDPIALSISTNPGNATLSGGNGHLTDASGNAIFDALSLSAGGNSYHLQAIDLATGVPPVGSVPFNVLPTTQTIVFTTPSPSPVYVGANYTPVAQATSGLPVAFSIDASSTGVCALQGGLVVFTAAGACVIDANQPGNASYLPAPQVQRIITVTVQVGTHLAFAAQPGDVVAGMPMSVTVAVLDDSGLIVESDQTTQVVLAPLTCGVMTPLTATVVNGVAQFDNVRIYAASTGMELFANPFSGNLAFAQTDPFNVFANSELLFHSAFDIQGCVR
ncbi:MAG TPA: protease pro-enzyme activation domain-containing protein, partial [Rudaea sp.]